MPGAVERGEKPIVQSLAWKHRCLSCSQSAGKADGSCKYSSSRQRMKRLIKRLPDTYPMIMSPPHTDSRMKEVYATVVAWVLCARTWNVNSSS